jgi:hypothetical protein
MSRSALSGAARSGRLCLVAPSSGTCDAVLRSVRCPVRKAILTLTPKSPC